MRRWYLLLLPLALVAWNPATQQGGGVPAAAGGPTGTDFLANANCLAAWDFEVSYNDLCEADSYDNNLTAGGAAWSNVTFDALAAKRTNDGWYETPDSAEWTAIVGANSYTAICMVGYLTGATTTSYDGIIDRASDFGMLVNTGTEGFFYSHNVGQFGLSGSDGDDLDVWQVPATTYNHLTNIGYIEVERNLVNGPNHPGLTSATITFQPQISNDTSMIHLGCLNNEMACPDMILRSCMIYGAVMTTTEICEFYAYGPSGESWDLSGDITCE